ncbi:MAG: S24 family peptidase [Sphingosinicella sp.]
MDEADARAALQRLIAHNRDDYAGLSRLLGRNPAYIQQYLKRGSPRRLAEADRRRLAYYFGVDERELGAPDPAIGPHLVTPRRLDVGASAGPGALGQETPARPALAFDPNWLRALGVTRPDQLSIVRVEGDSMAPTLADGDEILVDRGDHDARLRDGVYVLRVEEALVVKRLSLNPAARRITITSDNPAAPGWGDCDPDAITIVGRVVWAGRRIGLSSFAKATEGLPCEALAKQG